jgi:hypothetical protein
VQNLWTVGKFLLSIYFFRMAELNNFYNAGFGWICRACASAPESETTGASHSRLLREGEAESKAPRLSNFALAKWADKSRTTLVCPRCGTRESVGES